jgi:hypothetical protein
MSWIRSTFACFASLAVLACAGTKDDSSAIDPLLTNLEHLRVVDWRCVSTEISPLWQASLSSEGSPHVYTHVRRKHRDSCTYCESLIFETDEYGKHLRAIDVTRRSRSKSDAVGLANELLRAALPARERFRPIVVSDEAPIIKSYGKPSPNPDVILDARVFQLGDLWLVNLYWSRVYIPQGR